MSWRYKYSLFHYRNVRLQRFNYWICRIIPMEKLRSEYKETNLCLAL